MARSDFTDQLRSHGYDPVELGDGKVAFDYIIPVGQFAGKTIKLGFIVGEDFSLNPPSGPHVSPELLPRQAGGSHPSGGIHESQFGNGWQYWSRPFPNWNRTDRTVRAYMSHIRHLFDTQ